MLLLTHITFAIASLLFSAIVFISPSRLKLRFSLILTTLTLASGTVLVITTKSSLLSSCMSGIIYLALITPVLFAAQKKLLGLEPTLK
jgi:hypothetical protein